MNCKIENKKGHFQIEMVFLASEWEKEIDAAYNATASKYIVQGFRKGKAPRGVIEKNYGEGIFTEEALQSAFSREYGKVLKEHAEIKPIDYPSIKEFKAEKDGGMKIAAVVDVEPTFTVGKYTGLEIKKQKVNVTDKDVDAYLAGQAAQRARQIAADKNYKIVVGDTAVIDFVGSVGGVEFEGGKGFGHELEIGSHSFIDNFEDQLVGAKIGDEVIVNVKFPEQYHAKNLAGAAAKFVVNVKNILRKEVPAIDDQFAKEASEFDNLADWKKSVRENLVKEAEAKVERDSQNELLKAIVADTKIDVPAKMVEMQLDNIMHDLEYRLAYQGMNLQMYADYTGMTIDALREGQRENAATSVKLRLVFDAIADKEKINVTAAELDEEVKRIAAANNKKAEEYSKNKAQMEFIEQNLRFDKLVKFLVSNNKIS